MSKNKTTEHSFNIEIAQELGIEEAVLYKNILYWVENNKANNKNFKDGRYWTYNSVSAFLELFPYMSEYKISSALKKLEEAGYIVSGVYNKADFDRTKWYSVNQVFDSSKTTNGDGENHGPIPDINTYVNRYIAKDDFKEDLKALRDKYSTYEYANEITEEDRNILLSNCETPTEYLRYFYIGKQNDLYLRFWKSHKEPGYKLIQRHKSEVSKFIDWFNLKTLEEGTTFNKNMIYGLQRSANTWLENLDKNKKKNDIGVKLQPGSL